MAPGTHLERASACATHPPVPLTPHPSIIPTGGTTGDGEEQPVGSQDFGGWHETGLQGIVWVKGKDKDWGDAQVAHLDVLKVNHNAFFVSRILF